MVDLGSALDLLFDGLGGLGPVGRERLPLVRAHGRVLAEDVVARRPVPDAPRAAMDGYALSSRDVGTLSGGLPVAGRVLPGETPQPLRPGEVRLVATGALLPQGADAVVPLEQVRAVDAGGRPAGPEQAERVLLPRIVAPGSNVVPPGELVPAGTPVLRTGTRLGPAEIGLLACLGRGTVSVWRRPTVILLPVGDELVPPGRPRAPGGVYESNVPMLRAACVAAGARPVALPPVSDLGPDLAAALRSALAREPLLVLSTGGVSVGPADRVPAAWHELGAETLFWRVAIKPGKPVFAGRLGRTAILGLSGNPLACWTAFQLLAAPLLRHWAGCGRPFPPAQQVRLAEALDGHADMLRPVWARVEPGPASLARPLPRKRAGALVHMVQANALLLHPAGAGPLPAGRAVWALRLDRVGEEGEADTRELLAAVSRPGGTLASSDRGIGSPAPWGSQRRDAIGAGRWPVVCALGGYRGHGKTILLERLAAAFAAAGEPVATLKHHGHATPFDAPGKDGYRHRVAGACLTVVSGPGGVLWSEQVEGEIPPETLLAALRARARALGCVWILVEGYHHLPLPRVEVLDTASTGQPRCDPRDGLFLIAATDPSRVQAPPGVEVVARDDVAAIVAAVRRRCLDG
jgi:molybdopterin molybdotransferase